MVRFARVKGSNTKSSFNKVPEEASTWDELTQRGGDDEVVEEESTEVAAVAQETGAAVWSSMEPEGEQVKKKKLGKGEGKKPKKARVEKEAEGVEFKRRKLVSDEVCLSLDGVEVPLVKFDGYLVTSSDAEKLTELRERLRSEGKSERDIFAMVKVERRKAERFVKMKKKTLCFHCRKGGHNLSDCPELEGPGAPSLVGSGAGSGVCFKCGSTEHRLPQCKSKTTTLQFATCFICGESGHLSKSCGNNPRGLYPDGGGCKSCGDVTHYERDCPTRQKRKAGAPVTARTIDPHNVEALDYDDNNRKQPMRIDINAKRPNKVIKF